MLRKRMEKRLLQSFIPVKPKSNNPSFTIAKGNNEIRVLKHYINGFRKKNDVVMNTYLVHR